MQQKQVKIIKILLFCIEKSKQMIFKRKGKDQMKNVWEGIKRSFTKRIISAIIIQKALLFAFFLCHFNS